jgi:hypothetical protein
MDALQIQDAVVDGLRLLSDSKYRPGAAAGRGELRLATPIRAEIMVQGKFGSRRCFVKSMLQIIAGTATFLGGLVAASTASAQVTAISPTSMGSVGVSPWFTGGASYGGGTADGNYFFGAAQVIRAEGEYNELTTRGMINFETARSRYIENAAKWSQFYSQMREGNEAYRRQKIEQNRHSPDVLAQVAASDVPRSLSSDEIDLVTGRITWPVVLMDDQYAAVRADLEHLSGRHAWTARTPETSAKIHQDTRKMIEMLRNNIENVPAGEYVAARRFIEALDYSAMNQRRTPEPPRPRLTGG